MDQTLGRFCDWLAATPFSQLLQTLQWIIPLTQSAHIGAVSIVMGSVIMLDLKLLGLVGRDVAMASMARRFLPWIWGALAVLLISGALLTTAEPRRELLNVVYRLKMALILIAAGATALFAALVRRRAEAWGSDPSRLVAARVLAVASLTVWVAIVVCGRWIAYVEHG